jgi:spore cortex formation protein SpoVR/YcgB (stage V sporulation)
VTTPAAGDGQQQQQGPAGGDGPADTTGERLDRLEGAVGRIEAALGRVVPAAHEASRDRVEARLDRPTSVEEQVEAELAKRDKRARADKDKADRDKAEKDWRDQTEQRLAALAEKPPAPPERRATRILGWGRGA